MSDGYMMNMNKCPGGGMADAEDSKSFVGNNVGVQVPSRAPSIIKPSLCDFKSYRLFYLSKLKRLIFYMFEKGNNCNF